MGPTHQFDVRRRFKLGASGARGRRGRPQLRRLRRRRLWRPREEFRHLDGARRSIRNRERDVYSAGAAQQRRAPGDVPAGIALGPSAGRCVHHGQHDIDGLPDDARCAPADVRQRRERRVLSKISFGSVAQPLHEPRAEQAGVRLVGVQPTFAGRFAVDGDPTTRWSSGFSDPQWIYVDLEQTIAVGEVILRWETAYGADYQVQMSNDAPDVDDDPQRDRRRRRRGRPDRPVGIGTLSANPRDAAWNRVGILPLGARSVRRAGYAAVADLARHHPAVASSVAFGSASFAPGNAVDGSPTTRWSSEFSDTNGSTST